MDEQDEMIEFWAEILGATAGAGAGAIMSTILTPAGGAAYGAAVNFGVRKGIKKCGPYALDVAGAIYDVVTGREPGPPERCPPCGNCGGHRRPDEVAQYKAAGRSLAY